jgi:hypothetical protein
MPYSTAASLRVALLWNSVALIVLLFDALMFKARNVCDFAKNAVSGCLIACIFAGLLFKLPYFRRRQGTLDLGEWPGVISMNKTSGFSIKLSSDRLDMIKSYCTSDEPGQVTINNLSLNFGRITDDKDQDNKLHGSTLTEVQVVPLNELTEAM